MKISKISQSTTESDLKSFFKNNSIVEDGIKFNRHSSNGEAIIIFETEEECFEAIQKNNGRLLKNQSISLSESNLDEFEEFAGTMAFENWMPILSELINTENVKRSLYLIGFPLDISTSQIVQFLAQFNISHSNLIVNDKILKNFGSIIIKLKILEVLLLNFLMKILLMMPKIGLKIIDIEIKSFMLKIFFLSLIKEMLIYNF